jgi:hypothetical protein
VKKKRLLALATATLLVVGALGAGVASAHRPPDRPSGPPAANPSTSHRAVTFSARCTPAFPGSVIKVKARVGHAVRGTPFSAVASAALAGGPVNVNMRRAGRSFVAHGRIPVPTTQPVGPVVVTVTITYGGTATVLTCTSRIFAVGPKPTPTPTPTPTPAP